jgi:hypothetical protein
MKLDANFSLRIQRTRNESQKLIVVLQTAATKAFITFITCRLDFNALDIHTSEDNEMCFDRCLLKREARKLFFSDTLQ